jgi:hypothetical protein
MLLPVDSVLRWQSTTNSFAHKMAEGCAKRGERNTDVDEKAWNKILD